MPKSPHRAKVNKIGSRARRKLPELMKRHGNKCYWCSTSLVMWRKIRNIAIEYDHYTVSFRKHGKLKTRHIASVDHVVSIFKGGTNDIKNLVPACKKCNERRGREQER